MQKTTGKTVEFQGPGLHSGKMTLLRLIPAAPDSGIRFKRSDLQGSPEIPARVEYFRKMPFMCSALTADGASVQLIEHIMAALAAYGVDNLVVELDNEEPPFEDGSSMFISDMLEDAGLVEQGRPRQVMCLSRPVSYTNGEIEISAVPSDVPRLTFFAHYNHPMIGEQSFTIVPDIETFRSLLAPARTFCFEQDVNRMNAAGLLKGASEQSALVFGKEGLLNGSLLFPDEPVRHKMLDLMGDLYLLGAPLLAHVTAVKSGHESHAEFVKILRKEKQS